MQEPGALAWEENVRLWKFQLPSARGWGGQVGKLDVGI